LSEGQKHLKAVADAKLNVAKAKDAYEKVMKEIDAAKDAHIKAEKDEAAQPDKKNLPPITKKAAERLGLAVGKKEAALTAYSSAVTKANEEVSGFRTERMPQVLEALQVWEEDRWNALLGALKTFRGLAESVPTGIDEQLKDVVTAFDAANIDEDFNEVITSLKKETKDDQVIEVVVFKSKHGDDDQSAPVQEEKQESKAETKEVKEDKTAAKDDEDMFK